MPLAPMNLRQNPVAGTEYPGLDALDVAVPNKIDNNSNKNNILKIELPDGSVSINLSPGIQPRTNEDDDFYANLAMEIDQSVLGAIGNELHRLIKQDDESRQEWLQQYVLGLDLLGTKIETPRSNASDGSTAVEGQSTVRHPLLIESIVRFQANARGELLPASGPVKVRNDALNDQQADVEANALQKDFNHYLTVTAPEYYPDTERMFFSLGFGGTSFKKVYMCPIRRRPVSEFVDVKDVIVSNAETSLETAQRITHVVRMSPSTLKRMQLLGVYRNVPLAPNSSADKNIVDQKIESLQGVKQNNTASMENKPREIWECYCELDIPGFEHQEDGEPTGLQLPYRVTLDKETQEILEIRRWWKQGDENYIRKRVFVNYTFIPGFGFYGLGLLHLLGNTTMALTAGMRLCIDNGMFANFPGFLYAKQAGRQNTNEFRVAPGSGMPIETGGQPIQNMIMNLPYRGVDGGFLTLLKQVEDGGQRLGGIADTAVGEGQTEAPVGTTIALIDQATKVMSAVHKRMHAAQALEFELLKDLFKETPTAFWENNKYPAGQWTEETLIAALDNVNLVPVADPNNASQTARIQKAMAIKQLQAANPTLYNARAVDERILTILDIDDAGSLFNNAPPGGPQADPANMLTAQAKMIDAQAKTAEVKVRALDAAADAQNRAADRESKEKIAMYQLAREIAVHPESSQVAENVVKDNMHDNLGSMSQPEVGLQ